MPLVPCPDCGREISDAAPACVGCGRPLDARGLPPSPGASGRAPWPARRSPTLDAGADRTAARAPGAGARPTTAAAPSPEPRGPRPLPSCDACGSDDVRLLRMVHETGSAATGGETVTRMVGHLVGTGIGVGSAHSESRGWELTDLARRAAPPARPQYPSRGKQALRLFVAGSVLAPVLFVACRLITASPAGTPPSDDAMMWYLFGPPGIALAFYGFAKERDRGRAERDEASFQASMRAWERSAMCMRCGNVVSAA